MADLLLLDGPMGTELERRGVSTSLPLWSASALDASPDVVAQIHRDYVAAGADVITTNTFRTQRATVGSDWERLTRLAVRLAKSAAGSNVRVAGSIAPLMDCYRPDLSPPGAAHEHQAMAALLAEECDLILCETFPHAGEALAAARAAVATGKETWVALTAGPEGDLMTPAQMHAAGERLVAAGASALLVNCIAAPESLPFVEALAGLAVPVGVYANAGRPDESVGWRSDPEFGAERYLSFAERWRDAGATIVGACCGTGVQHITALHATWRRRG